MHSRPPPAAHPHPTLTIALNSAARERIIRRTAAHSPNSPPFAPHDRVPPKCHGQQLHRLSLGPPPPQCHGPRLHHPSHGPLPPPPPPNNTARCTASSPPNTTAGNVGQLDLSMVLLDFCLCFWHALLSPRSKSAENGIGTCLRGLLH